MVCGEIEINRDKGLAGTFSGGIAEMINEIDRVLRPSLQHVAEAQRPAISGEDDIGGE